MTSRDRTHYGELDVREDASPSRIRAAFRKLARRYHPDRNPHDGAAEENFKRINSAYLVLGDATKREAYDRVLRAGREAAETEARSEQARAPDASPPQQGVAAAQRAVEQARNGGVGGTRASGRGWARIGEVLPVFCAGCFWWLMTVALPLWVAVVTGLGLVVWAVYRRLSARRARRGIPSGAPKNAWITAAILGFGLLIPVLRTVQEVIERRYQPAEEQHKAEQRALARREAGWRDRLAQAQKLADVGDPEHALKLIGSLEDEIAAAREKADQHYIPGLIQVDVQDRKHAIQSVALVDGGIAKGKEFAQSKRWLAADFEYRRAANALKELYKASNYVWLCLPKGFDPARKKDEVSQLQLAISGAVAIEEELAYGQLCGPSPVVTEGEVVGLKTSIERRAHDPDSIEIVGCTTPVLSADTCWLFQCNVRGKNALGARVLQTRSYQKSTLGFHDETSASANQNPALEIEGPAPPGEPPVPRAQRGCCSDPDLLADDPNPGDGR